LFELLQLGAGLEAELAGQTLSAGLVDSERFCLPTGAIEADHQVAEQPLAIRVRGYEVLELTDEFGAVPKPEFRVDARLEREHAPLL
jgi:hypothetical protein